MDTATDKPWSARLVGPEYRPGQQHNIWTALECDEHRGTVRVASWHEGFCTSYDLTLPLALEEYERIRRRERWTPSPLK